MLGAGLVSFLAMEVMALWYRPDGSGSVGWVNPGEGRGQTQQAGQVVLGHR